MMGDGTQESLADIAAKAQHIEQQIGTKVSELQGLFRERGDLKQQIAPKNIGLGIGVGLPGLAALSYGHESLKDK